MSDFEDRLRGALVGGVADDPDASGLAGSARRRASARRRTTLAAAAVAVALAVVAVPVGMTALGGDPAGPAPAGDGPSASDPPSATSATPEVADGLRTETWRGLEIEVPDDWGYGALSTWCIGHDEPGDPVVERPGFAAAIACTPGTGYGAQFFDPAAYDPAYPPGHVRRIADEPGPMPFPVGSWVGYQSGGRDAAVLVVARTQEVARAVLDSADTVEDVDGNGCATRLGTDSAGSTPERVSVCRYAADGWLEQSELLSPGDGETAMEALAAAPVSQEPVSCLATAERYSTVVIGTGSGLGSVQVVWESRCPDERGVFFSGVVRELTADVMYWALSPGWSGGVDRSVPLPDRLRQR